MDWARIAHAHIYAHGFAAVLYFISVVLFGNLVMLNLLLAVFIDGIGAKAKDEIAELEAGMHAA